MVQAVNYSVIIVKLKCKNPQYHKLKALTVVEFFFIVNVFHHMSRKTSRRDVEAPETLGSFKVSASVSEAATFRLNLGSEGLVHIPGFSKKICVLWSINKKKLQARILPHFKSALRVLRSANLFEFGTRDFATRGISTAISCSSFYTCSISSLLWFWYRLANIAINGSHDCVHYNIGSADDQPGLPIPLERARQLPVDTSA